MSNIEFSFKELYEVRLKTTYPIEIDGYTFDKNETIAFFDKIQIANIDEIKKWVSAHGGFDDRPHVIWEDTKEVNIKFVRKYLEYKFGHRCSICGNTHWLGQPILLIVDHIDGDIENHNVDNYRLVCSNCDATLPTYKNKNRGKGKRKYRRIK